MTAGHLNATASGELAQRATAEQVIREMTEEKVWDAPYSHSTRAFKSIYPAEDYHEDYFGRHPEQAYLRSCLSTQNREAATTISERTESADVVGQLSIAVGRLGM